MSHILQKNINFIDFTDFLSRIDTGSVISHLHYNAVPVLQKIDKHGKCQWEGNVYTKEKFLEKLQEEEGNLCELSIVSTPFGPEAILKFSSGHGFTISLKEEGQFVQIFRYLIEIQEPKKPYQH